jgi:hypothetical protein
MGRLKEGWLRVEDVQNFPCIEAAERSAKFAD